MDYSNNKMQFMNACLNDNVSDAKLSYTHQPIDQKLIHDMFENHNYEILKWFFTLDVHFTVVQSSFEKLDMYMIAWMIRHHIQITDDMFISLCKSNNFQKFKLVFNKFRCTFEKIVHLIEQNEMKLIELLSLCTNIKILECINVKFEYKHVTIIHNHRHLMWLSEIFDNGNIDHFAFIIIKNDNLQQLKYIIENNEYCVSYITLYTCVVYNSKKIMQYAFDKHSRIFIHSNIDYQLLQSTACEYNSIHCMKILYKMFKIRPSREDVKDIKSIEFLRWIHKKQLLGSCPLLLSKVFTICDANFLKKMKYDMKFEYILASLQNRNKDVFDYLLDNIKLTETQKIIIFIDACLLSNFRVAKMMYQRKLKFKHINQCTSYFKMPYMSKDIMFLFIAEVADMHVVKWLYEELHMKYIPVRWLSSNMNGMDFQNFKWFFNRVRLTRTGVNEILMQACHIGYNLNNTLQLLSDFPLSKKIVKNGLKEIIFGHNSLHEFKIFTSLTNYVPKKDIRLLMNCLFTDNLNMFVGLCNHYKFSFKNIKRKNKLFLDACDKGAFKIVSFMTNTIEEYDFDMNINTIIPIVKNSLNYLLKNNDFENIKKMYKLKKSDDISDECSICYEKANCKTECNHTFCFECIMKWMYYSTHCPYCKNIVNIKKILIS